MRLILSLLITVLALSACSSYSCEEAPQANIPIFAEHTIIKAVNDKPLGSRNRGALVFPGETRLSVIKEQNNMSNEVVTASELNIDAKKGKEYVVKPEGDSICIYERSPLTHVAANRLTCK